MTETSTEVTKVNPMRELKVAKLAVNIAVGKSGEPLEKGVQVLQSLTGKKPSRRNAKKTIKTYAIRKGEPIACLVTLRRVDAIAFLKKALETVNNRLQISSFDKMGNLTFGIKEHIEIPGTKYDPEIGIYGLNVSVAFERPGYRVKRRRLKRSHVGKRHKVLRTDAIEYIRKNFGIEVVGE